MNAFMEAVLTEVRDEPSSLARARLQRQLTPDEAARRAGLTPEEVEWLEEGRLDRCRSSERATPRRPSPNDFSPGSRWWNWSARG